jgi:hypothetical protein
MSETAGDLIKDALGEIIVLGAEAPLEAVDAQAGIRYLNRMMAAFDVDGIDLGYTEVSNLSDIITVPTGAIAGMISQLAIMLFAQFSQGEPVPADLVARALSGKNTMRNIAVIVGQTEFQSTLPTGSGNEGDRTHNDHFYPDLESTILAESNGSVGLEESTE